MGNQRRSLIKSVGALAGGNLAASLLSAVGGVIVARLIDPTINGEFRYYSLPLMYLVFLQLGTFEGLGRQIPFYAAQGMGERVERLAAAAAGWNALLAVGVGAVFVLLEVAALIEGDVRPASGWLVQALVSISVFYGGYLNATFRTLNGFVAIGRVQFVQAVLSFFLIASVGLWGFYGLCARAAVPALVGVYLLNRVRPIKVPPIIERNSFFELLKVGFPFCLWGSIYNPLWLATEATLVHKVGGATVLGYYSIGLIVKEAICILPQAVNQVLLPVIVAQYASDGNIDRGLKQGLKLAMLLAAIMTVVALVVGIVLDSAIPLVIPMYIGGVGIMKILLWHSVLQALSIPLNSLIAHGSSSIFARGVVLGCFGFLLSSLLLLNLVGGVEAILYGSIVGRLVRIVSGYVDMYLVNGNR